MKEINDNDIVCTDNINEIRCKLGGIMIVTILIMIIIKLM